MPQTALGKLTLPAVVVLISFLSYGAQVLFLYIEPHPLSRRQTVISNLLIGCIWVTYYRACFTDPGWVPSDWGTEDEHPNAKNLPKKKQRWCRKCEAFKPPRAHHCKICARCVPKMDHHCPWTINCVSHRTFPHFFRFLIYTVTSMSYLEYLIYTRGDVIWASRNLPSYLGPSAAHMIFLFIFFTVNSITLFAIGLLLARNIWCLGINVTTIEGWEIERHATLVRRAKALGGYLDGPEGIKVKIQKQEFPYDIGIWRNVRQGWGQNPLLWMWPFAPSPSNESGLNYETNGFENHHTSWPPPDPDRMLIQRNHTVQGNAFIHEGESLSGRQQLDNFRLRQQEDLKRFNKDTTQFVRQRPFRERYINQESPAAHRPSLSDNGGSNNGEEAWRDSEGERLDDFGVDEDIEFYDEDDVPLAELLRRRRTGNGC